MPINFPSPSQVSAVAPRTHQAFNVTEQARITKEQLALQSEVLEQQGNFWKLQAKKFAVISDFWGAFSAKNKSKVAREGANQSLVQAKIAEESTKQISWSYVAAKANTVTAKEQATQASDRAAIATYETPLQRSKALNGLKQLSLEAGTVAVNTEHLQDLTRLQQKVREVVRIPQQLPQVSEPNINLH